MFVLLKVQSLRLYFRPAGVSLGGGGGQGPLRPPPGYAPETRMKIYTLTLLMNRIYFYTYMCLCVHNYKFVCTCISMCICVHMYVCILLGCEIYNHLMEDILTP